MGQVYGNLVKVVTNSSFYTLTSPHLVPEVVKGVCIWRHGCSILVPSLRLSIEHVHPSISRPSTQITSLAAIAIQAMFTLSTQDPRVFTTACIEGSKHRVCWPGLIGVGEPETAKVCSFHLPSNWPLHRACTLPRMRAYVNQVVPPFCAGLLPSLFNGAPMTI